MLNNIKKIIINFKIYKNFLSLKKEKDFLQIKGFFGKIFLKIPENIVPHAIITFGYGKNIPKEQTKRFDLDKVTFFGEWGNRNNPRGLFPLVKHAPCVSKLKCNLLEKLKNIFSKKKNETPELLNPAD